MATTEYNVGASQELARVGPESLAPVGSEVEAQVDGIERALLETYGAPGRRQQRRGADLNRAYVTDIGYAGFSDKPDGIAAYNVSPENGSIALAEGRGTDTGVETAVRGFGYAMWRRQTQHAKTIGKVLGLIQNGMDEIPEAIALAQTYQSEEKPAAASVVGVQLFDNKLIVNGRRPVFVYDLQTGDCTWPNRVGGHGPSGSYIHTLNVGRHIVVMSTGRNSDSELGTLRVRAAIENVLTSSGDDTPATAQTIAEGLHTLLASNDSQGALLVNIIELGVWQDRRPLWKKLGDYTLRLPSTAIYGVAAFAIEKKRRQLYEARTRGGRLGRTMAIAADLAFDAGFVAFALTLGKNTMGLLHELDGLLGAGTHALPPTEAFVPADTAVPHIEAPPPHIVEPYTDSRIAAGHDPLSAGQASTVSNWSHDALQHYGEQEGLPQTEIDKLTHDPHVITEVNNAFYHDSANPNNQKVADDARHWLNAGDNYSQIDQGDSAHKIVIELKHELGLDTSPPSVAEPAQPPVVASLPPAATPPNAAENYSSISQLLSENWAPIAAASGAGLLVFGAAASHRRSRRRKRAELVHDINRGRMITSHNQDRRRYNQKLLAAGRLPLRGLGSGPIAQLSMLEDDDEALALPDAAQPKEIHALAMPQGIPRQKVFSGRFDDIT